VYDTVLVGIIATCAIWFATCVAYRRAKWYVFTTGSCLTVALLEGLAFLVFRSSICNEMELGALPEAGFPAVTVVSTCAIGWGAIAGILAVVLWTLAALSTWRYVPPKSTEERMLEWIGRQPTGHDESSSSFRRRSVAS